MTEAQTLTQALGGEWRGHSGLAPCPVCQIERRPDQRGLSIRAEGGALLAFCHKSGCDFRDIVRAAGLPRDALRIDPHAAREADADRILPISPEAEAVLKKRTLTNLYNAKPAWLTHAHKTLDDAVADAFGWGDDFRAGKLTDDEILARLFRLNQERAAAVRLRVSKPSATSSATERMRSAMT